MNKPHGHWRSFVSGVGAGEILNRRLASNDNDTWHLHEGRRWDARLLSPRSTIAEVREPKWSQR